MLLTEPLARSVVLPELAAQAPVALWTDVVTALGVGLLALMGLALAVGGLIALRALTRALRAVERAVERLSPQAEPLLGKAARVAEDASEVTHAVRSRIEEMTDTLGDLNSRLRSAVGAAEDRARQFGMVLDVIQEQVEDLLLDAASTARGVHAAAEALRRPPVPRRTPQDEGPEEPSALG